MSIPQSESRLKRLRLKTDNSLSKVYDIGANAENIDIDENENLSQRLDKINENIKKANEKAAGALDSASTALKSTKENKEKIDEVGVSVNDLDKITKMKPYVFKTVAEMKACKDLKVGDVVETLGYYEANDDGAARYEIVDKIIENADNLLKVEIENEKIARMIIDNNKVNAAAIGIFPNSNDNASTILQYSNLYSYDLIFEEGTYLVSEMFFKKGMNCNLVGLNSIYDRKTTFKPFQNNQRYIIKIGGKEDFSVSDESDYTIDSFQHFKIDGINFTDYDRPLATTNRYQAIVVLDNCLGGKINVNFVWTKSTCLMIRESWEIKSDYISIRNNFGDINTKAILFANRAMIKSGSNITALFFDVLDFEMISGKAIYCEDEANIQNCVFNIISVENGRENSLMPKCKSLGLIKSNTVDDCYKNYLKNNTIKLVGNVSINTITIQNWDTYFNSENDTSKDKYVESIYLSGSVNIGNLITTCGFIYLNNEDSIKTTSSISKIDSITYEAHQGRYNVNAYPNSIMVYKPNDLIQISSSANPFILINPHIGLTVPANTTNVYSGIELWKIFKNILGVSKIGYDNDSNVPCYEYYNYSYTDVLNKGGLTEKINILKNEKLTLDITFKTKLKIAGRFLYINLYNQKGELIKQLSEGYINNVVDGEAADKWYSLSVSIPNDDTNEELSYITFATAKNNTYIKTLKLTDELIK